MRRLLSLCGYLKPAAQRKCGRSAAVWAALNDDADGHNKEKRGEPSEKIEN
jgi:hypothetical protein